jgi:predicted nuclease of restriction endonuclease-like (RecB) superfamily
MSKKQAPASPTSTLRPDFYQSIAEILQTARRNAHRAVNSAMVEAYWQIGRMIVEEEQQGKSRAIYGVALIQSLSVRLTAEFGKGFSENSLWNFRKFYLAFPDIHEAIDQHLEPSGSILSTVWRESDQTLDNGTIDSESLAKQVVAPRFARYELRPELTWSHYKCIMRVENPSARTYYLNEAADQNWSVRALERQINSLYYERILASRNRAPVIDEMRENTAALAPQPQDFIKDPYVLEFLGLQDSSHLREAELEQAIIDKLQAFLLELGKGFAFVARQQHIRTATKEFYVDLVFYNFILKCFVLLDLKTGELTHQDIGQMDMYVRLYEDKFKGADDNPTIGIILCTEKDETIVKYSVLEENQQLFAARYRLYLPTEQELIEEIEREKQVILRERRELYTVYQ